MLDGKVNLLQCEEVVERVRGVVRLLVADLHGLVKARKTCRPLVEKTRTIGHTVTSHQTILLGRVVLTPADQSRLRLRGPVMEGGALADSNGILSLVARNLIDHRVVDLFDEEVVLDAEH